MKKLIAIEISRNFHSPFGKTSGLGDLISLFLNIALVASGVILLFLFIGGGIMMISSAGSGDSQGASRGKQAVTSAVLGFLLVFVAYWVIRFLEVVTGTNFVTQPTF